jgi:sugar-specific transcriptional regulator TrmB
LSLERVLQLLESFGFSRVDAQVYVYLAKKGPQKSKDLSVGLKIAEHQLYPALKRLKRRGIVKNECAEIFSALEIEELLKLVVKIKVNQAKFIQQNKKELLSCWQNNEEKNNN